MNIHKILAEIEEAYPDDVFPETTKGEREDVMECYPGFIDRTSAMMGRHLAKVIRRKLAELEDDETEMTDAERGDRLEAVVDRMSEKLSDCVLLINPMYDLCQQIEICGASVELTKAVTMASDIMHKLMDATGVKQLPPRPDK
jgi:DNA-binding transcriptional regulator GbsR (MarR family)